MTVVISSIAEERGGKIYAQLYAYTEQERGDEDTVRDNNHALDIVRQLSGDDGEYFKDGRPQNGVRMFDICIRITDTRHDKSRYTADYHRYPGCPQRVAGAMMDIYHTIKSVIRESRNALRKRKQQRKGTDR